MHQSSALPARPASWWAPLWDPPPRLRASEPGAGQQHLLAWSRRGVSCWTPVATLQGRASNQSSCFSESEQGSCRGRRPASSHRRASCWIPVTTLQNRASYRGRYLDDLSKVLAGGITWLEAVAGFPAGYLLQHSRAEHHIRIGVSADLSKALAGGIARFGAPRWLLAEHLWQYSRAGHRIGVQKKLNKFVVSTSASLPGWTRSCAYHGI